MRHPTIVGWHFYIKRFTPVFGFFFFPGLTQPVFRCHLYIHTTVRLIFAHLAYLYDRERDIDKGVPVDVLCKINGRNL